MTAMTTVRRVRRWGAALALAALALALTGCERDGVLSGTLVRYGEHTIAAGQAVDGDLVVVGGRVVVEPGARVTGAVYVVGGEAAIDGEAGEGVTLLNGDLALGPQARVRGDLRIGGGTLERAAGAVVEGRLDTGVGVRVPSTPLWRATLDRSLRAALDAALLAGLAAALVRFWPRPVRVVGQTAAGEPLAALALGLLVAVVAPTLLVLMVFTLVLIPVTLLVALLLALTLAYGWAAAGGEVGAWLAGRLGWRLTRARQAALGTLALTLAAEALALVPFAG